MAERLCNVVIGSETQSHQFIDLFILARKKDDRKRRPCAQSLEKFNPVHSRHFDIEYGEINRVGRNALESTFAVGIRHEVKLLAR